MNNIFAADTLTPAESESITRFAKSYGAEWVERQLNQKRANKYIEANMDRVEELCTRASPYPCYVAGTDVYRRKDGEPITHRDLNVFKLLDRGQENKVSVAANSMTISSSFVCDSSG